MWLDKKVALTLDELERSLIIDCHPMVVIELGFDPMVVIDGLLDEFKFNDSSVLLFVNAFANAAVALSSILLLAIPP